MNTQHGFAYLGGVEEGQLVLRRLLEAGWRPEVILALEEESLAGASGGKAWLESEWDGVPLVKVPSFQCHKALQTLGRFQCRGILAVGVSEIFKEDFLAIFPAGVYGFHGSLLPALAGSAPVNWAIINGLAHTGTTLLRYTKDLDGGLIVGQLKCQIGDDETVGSLYSKLSSVSADLWMNHWPGVQQGQINGDPLGRLPLNLRRRPEDGLIQWKRHDASTLSRFVRGLSHPYPGAFFWWMGRRIWVHEAHVEDGPSSEGPVLCNVKESGITVSLPGGCIRLGGLVDDSKETVLPRVFQGWVGRKLSEFHRARRVLAVVAHPDDEVLGPGGALIRHFKNGDEVFVRIVCSEDPIRYREEGPDQASDAQRAAYYLGAETRGLGFPDQRLDGGSNLELIQAIEKEVQALSPQVVYTHHWGDINADHTLIAEAVDVAVRPYSAPWVERVLAFETASSTEWTLASRSKAFHPNVYVDISSELDRKLDAMRAYSSELKKYPHPRSLKSLRERAGIRGAESGYVAAEGFQLLRERT